MTTPLKDNRVKPNPTRKERKEKCICGGGPWATMSLHAMNCPLYKPAQPAEEDHCQACNGDGVWHQGGTIEHPAPFASDTDVTTRKERECKHKWQIIAQRNFTQTGLSGETLLAVCVKCLERRSI